MEELNEMNYFSVENNMRYFGSSQIKSFLQCEAKGLAEARGEYVRPETEALASGKFIDAWLTGGMDGFIEEHPTMFKKDGTMKVQYKRCLDAAERASRDNVFTEYMAGEKQVIMTGKIFGYDFKIKVDALHDDKIVDLKYIRDFGRVYKEGIGYTDFITAWGYDLQGYIYQQVVKANTGRSLPFYIAAITKETVPDIAVIHVPDWKLQSAGAVIEDVIGHLHDLKIGKEKPKRCGRCDFCKETKVLQGPQEYEAFIGLEEEPAVLPEAVPAPKAESAKEKRRRYSREWRKRNKKKVKEYNRRYRQKKAESRKSERKDKEC
jgi:hypothetical protein